MRKFQALAVICLLVACSACNIGKQARSFFGLCEDVTDATGGSQYCGIVDSIEDVVDEYRD